MHASKLEASRCNELVAKEAAGEITHLVQQPVFKIEIGGRLICRVILDFEYRMTDSGLQIDEDVKGKDTAVARLKRKLVEASHPGVVVSLWPVPKRKSPKRRKAA